MKKAKNVPDNLSIVKVVKTALKQFKYAEESDCQELSRHWALKAKRLINLQTL